MFISNSAHIGKNVVIFHQVTIGSVTTAGSKNYGAPTIGDDVYIGCGAKIIGNVINDVEVMDYNKLRDYVEKEHIDIGIICVNRENAQNVADDLVAGGVKGIWNFAPIDLVVPENVALESVHLSDSLHALSFMIKNMSEKETGSH